LRVSKEGELEGLDLHEHGISAYPEYVISSIAMPAAMTLSRDPKTSVESHARISYGEAQR
jgi:Amt family ammonium transporter